ncbi:MULTISPECIES: late competence development ComFB family protein [Lysinibacillus]|uniref:Competence protein ComFB n=1 Tax=Lysinibacillus antri TaxID=2498145 RepID=A0A3S0QQA7_9BACI|nr:MULTISPECIES: late competence development ComFB family protein [Lysinibacillus]RUL53640.1 competence protein ComFB [Lysinibacillus antri]TSI06459.1 competence protein ComFB [Lysinibacillus sp. BW-2-10]
MTEPILVNVTEEIVSGLVRFLLHGTDYQTFCHCNYCETEITADVLNKLPTYYVANNEARNEAFKQLKSPENIEKINREIILSIYAVGKNKNHA